MIITTLNAMVKPMIDLILKNVVKHLNYYLQRMERLGVGTLSEG